MKNQLKFRSGKHEGQATGRMNSLLLFALMIVYRLVPFIPMLILYYRPDLVFQT